MALIEKMAIRGIRSFSPDCDQTIEFYSPLTMIVGANGCGKTTIIESLKYICTGVMPPNSSKGQSFVNDPNVTDSTEVKVIKKKSKLTFQAIDGVIKTANAQGEKVSSSQKCQDLDKMIPEMLAVSAPILENVIFCHQEDSNWPMQEGTVLKKKFDDVFESTRYTKALEAIGKTKKEFQEKSKDIKADLAELAAQAQAANETKKEIEVCRESSDACESELQEIKDKLERIVDKLNQCDGFLRKAREHEVALKEIQIRVQESEKRLADRRDSLETTYNESTAELERMLANYDESVLMKTAEVQSLKNSITEIQGKIGALRGEYDKVNVLRGTADSLLQQLEGERAKLRSEISKVVIEYELPSRLCGDDWTLTQAKTVLQSLEAKIEDVQREGDDALRQSQATVQMCGKEVQEAQIDMQKVTVEVTTAERDQTRLNEDIRQKKIELTRLAAAKLQMQSTVTELADSRHKYEEFEKEYTIKNAQIKKSLKDVGDEIRTLTDRLAEDAQAIQELSSFRNELAAIAAAEKQASQDIAAVKSDIDVAITTHTAVLSEAGCDVHSPPTDATELGGWAHSLQKLQAAKSDSLMRKRDEYQNTRSRQSSIQSMLRQDCDRLSSMTNNANSLTLRMESKKLEFIRELNRLMHLPAFCGDFELFSDLQPSTTFADIVQRADEINDNAAGFFYLLKNNRRTIKSLKKARAAANGACPCCKQAMNATTAATFDKNVEDIIKVDLENTADKSVYKQISDEAKAVQTKASGLIAQEEPLQNIKSDIEIITKRIAQLEVELNDLNPVEIAAKGNIANLETSLETLGRAVSTLSDLRARWTTAAGRISEANEKRKRHSQSHSTFSSQYDSMQNIDALEENQQKNAERKDELQRTKDRLTNDEANLTKRLYAFKASLAEKEKEQLEAMAKSQKFTEVEEFMRAQQQRLSKVDEDLRLLKINQDNIKSNFEAVDLKYRTVQNTHKDRERIFQERISGIKSAHNDINRFISSAEEVQQRCARTDRNKLEEQAAYILHDISAKENQISQFNPRLNALSTELAAQERDKKLIRDNIDLRANVQEHRLLENHLRELEIQINADETKVRDSQREHSRAFAEQQRLSSDRDKISGNLEVYARQLRELTSKLSGPNYRGVEGKCRRKHIEYETTLMAINDLGSYHDALDQALQNFHVLKIREINKIIRELWQLIYKGQDIDMIEIESGQEADSGPSRGNRSYNYRVVMRKGDVPLDMRGRCSAGQKVLAGIVIRLALAETFCLNCGILALDEPTTNLDEANKAGLAHALARIIADRSSQHNFQLICITHDEDFVRLMNTELTGITTMSVPEHYFRISREEQGQTGKFFSRIERVLWESM